MEEKQKYYVILLWQYTKKWIEVEEKPNYLLKNSKYILTYFLGDKTKEYDKFINSIAQKKIWILLIYLM